MTFTLEIDSKCIVFQSISVGVGNDNFSLMEELDSDDTVLSVEDRHAERDIVQFVPLNNFLSKSGSHIKSQADLAEEVLAEIPEQLTSYMKSRGFRPEIETAIPPSSSKIVPTAPMARGTPV